MTKTPRRLILALGLTVAGCAGGTQEAAIMPTPVLCNTILNLGPVYARINEYYVELKRRNTDCSSELGNSLTVRVR